MLIYSGFGRTALFCRVNFGLKLLHLLLVVRVGHAAFPFGCLGLLLIIGTVRVNNDGEQSKLLINIEYLGKQIE